MIIEIISGLSSSWSQGVCCQAGRPEFDPQAPHEEREKADSCKLSSDFYTYSVAQPLTPIKNKMKKKKFEKQFLLNTYKSKRSVWWCTAHVNLGLLASLGIKNKHSSNKRQKEMSRKMRIGSFLYNSPLTWQELFATLSSQAGVLQFL